MCGLVGIVLGAQERTVGDYDHIRHVLGRLLLLSERRGPHAAGVALVRSDGTCHVHKAPGPASTFVTSAGYAELVAGIGKGTTVLLGHTRWATRGTPTDNRNNHPLQRGLIVGTHNGTITNADEVATRFGLRRDAEVDSEILFHLAARHVTPSGIDLSGWMADLASCRGDMTIAAAALTCPDELLLLRGDRPLAIAYEPELHLLVYGSERRILDAATRGCGRWSFVEIGPFQVLRARIGDVPRVHSEPFLISRPRRDQMGW